MHKHHFCVQAAAIPISLGEEIRSRFACSSWCQTSAMSGELIFFAARSATRWKSLSSITTTWSPFVYPACRIIAFRHRGRLRMSSVRMIRRGLRVMRRGHLEKARLTRRCKGLRGRCLIIFIIVYLSGFLS